jgi:5-methylcytosine-specific restriction endonuclease McrA
MNPDLQLPLSAFDRSSGPLCGDRPDANAFRALCHACPFSERGRNTLFCIRFQKPVGTRSKYGLPAWKTTRDAIRERDGYRCIICGSVHGLHVHHRDHDPTNDDPANLVTLCNYCHARVHAEERRDGGASVVEAVLSFSLTGFHDGYHP